MYDPAQGTGQGTEEVQKTELHHRVVWPGLERNTESRIICPGFQSFLKQGADDVYAETEGLR